MFNWEINLGHVIQILAFLGVAVAGFYAQKADIRILRHDIKYIEGRQDELSKAFTQLGTILTEVAVQDTRIQMIEKHIDELRHGKGFVKV